MRVSSALPANFLAPFRIKLMGLVRYHASQALKIILATNGTIRGGMGGGQRRRFGEMAVTWFEVRRGYSASPMGIQPVV